MVSSGDGTWGSWKTEGQEAPLCNLWRLWNFASCASTACSSWDYQRALIPNAYGHTLITPTRWTWVWMDSRSCWWTGRPGVLQFTGLRRVGHDWVTEPNWTPWSWLSCPCPVPFGWPSFSPGWDLPAEQSLSPALLPHSSHCLSHFLSARLREKWKNHFTFHSSPLSVPG